MSAFDGQADLLATLIASTATFQSVTGMSTVATAKERIALPEALDDDTAEAHAVPYPRAIITDGSLIERRSAATGTWRGTGSLFLAFEFEAPPDKRTELTQRAWFLNKVSTLLREAEVISDSRATPSGYSSTHLVLRSYRRVAGPFVVAPARREQPDDSEAELRPLWAIEFEVEY